MITKVRSHTQNDGKQMCFVGIEDNHGSIDGVIFARIYSQLQSLISVDSRVIAVGRINIRDDKRSVIIDDLVHINPVAPLNEAPETFALDIPWTIGKQKKSHRFVTLWSIFKATDAREGVPTRIRLLSNKGDLDVVIPSRPDQHQRLMDILR
jgi:DNA polymerase III alpha subunit